MLIWLGISIPAWINHILFIVYIVTILSCIGIILSENRNPIKSLAWVTVLIFLPVAGLVFYLFFGRSLKSLRMISRHKKRKLLGKQSQSSHVKLDEINLEDENKQIIKLGHSLNGAYFYENNDVEIFSSGKEKFDRLKKDLSEAQHSINLQYYIFKDDNLGHEIANILIHKAQEGVKVRVIYDHVGSFTVRTRFFKRLRDAGVDAHPFFRVTFPQLANRINWRNHRKIVIIDETIGYIGGMNIADRYINGFGKGKIWRDTHLRITGPIVNSLLYSFAVDWNFTNKKLINDEIPLPSTSTHNGIGMQFVTSGPNEIWPNIELLFNRAISSAKKSIYIQTPYFLPTDTLIQALQAAALSKIDVRIMLPRKSDSNILTLSSYSYIAKCLQSGIKVYLYEAGMLHSKNMIVDDEFVTSGSTNFDFRSFEYNFESNLFIYDRRINTKMKEIFFSDIENCTKLTLSTWQKRPKLQQFYESVIRLLSPIL